MHEEKTNRMDLIVSDIMSNVINQRAINQKIELVGFDPEDYGHLLYFEYALIIANFKDDEVCVNLPFGKYVKLIMSNWKNRKFIKRVPELKGIDTLDEILAHICEHHKINYTFFKKIYKDYCEVSK